MAFNVGAFIKDTAKTALNIITSGVVSDVTAGLNRYSISSADSTAKSLTATGASYKTAAAIAAQTVDVAASRGDPFFYAAAGKDVSKSASTDLASNRSLGSEDTAFLLENVIPDSKIKAKKADRAEAIMAVI